MADIYLFSSQHLILAYLVQIRTRMTIAHGEVVDSYTIDLTD